MSDMTDAQLLDYAAGLSAAPSSDEHDEGLRLRGPRGGVAFLHRCPGARGRPPRRTPPSSKGAEDVCIVDLTELSDVCDYFVIATGSNTRMVDAIVDEVEEKVAKTCGEHPFSIEGARGALVDSHGLRFGRRALPSRPRRASTTASRSSGATPPRVTGVFSHAAGERGVMLVERRELPPVRGVPRFVLAAKVQDRRMYMDGRRPACNSLVAWLGLGEELCRVHEVASKSASRARSLTASRPNSLAPRPS